MNPNSCANCWFNPMQYDSLGLSVGYCVEHCVLLRHADETTCGRQRRKDLTLPAAQAVHQKHEEQVPTDRVMRMVRSRSGVGIEEATDVDVEEDSSAITGDPVGEAVTEYGLLGTKIESLAQLRRIPGVRAELAMLSLGRAYVNRCVSLGGSWTSGLHLFRWTRDRLGEDPDVGIDDLRLQAPVPLHRQRALAQWSIWMLRLTLVSDIGHHASSMNGSPVGGLRSLAEDAAIAMKTLNPQRLGSWIRTTALPTVQRALPPEEESRLARELHRDG